MKEWKANEVITGSYDEKYAVKCNNGTFVGLEEEGIAIWKGIPFAEPPVGNLRWREPVPAADDDKVYEAYNWGPVPYNENAAFMIGTAPMSEDCLKLNIWTGSDMGKKKPVMFWIHGGGFFAESCADALYDLQHISREHKDVVFVSVEYRSGMFGFINLQDVPGAESYKAGGCLGILDQVCGLAWVKKNIEGFGGDPDNITIFGESAGGCSVNLIPMMKESKGLFKRVICQSGTMLFTDPREYGTTATANFMKAAGAKNMDDLLAMKAEDYMDIACQTYVNNAEMGMGGMEYPFMDGEILPASIDEAYERWEKGEFGDFDLVIGTVQDELEYFANMEYIGGRTCEGIMREHFEKDRKILSGDYAERLDKYIEFQMSRGKTEKQAIYEFYNDSSMRMPAIRMAEAHIKAGGKTYMYYVTAPEAGNGMGVIHAMELALLFSNKNVLEDNDNLYTGDTSYSIDFELKDVIKEMWTNFAKTGNPSTDKYGWEPYDLESRKTMFLGYDIEMVENPVEEARELISDMLKETKIGLPRELC